MDLGDFSNKSYLLWPCMYTPPDNCHFELNSVLLSVEPCYLTSEEQAIVRQELWAIRNIQLYFHA